MTENGSPADANASSPTTELPDKMRVHALARLLGATSREVLDHLEALGSEIRSASATIERGIAERVVERVGGLPTGEVAGSAESQTEAQAGGNSLFSAAAEITDAPIAAPVAPAAVNPLFLPPQQPEPSVVPSRKRAEAPVEAEDGAATDEAASDDEVVENEDDSQQDSDDQPNRARRRRRGRRGRGRGRGDNGDAQGGDDAEGDEQTEDGGTADQSAADAEKGTAKPASEADDSEASDTDGSDADESDDEDGTGATSKRRRRRRRRKTGGEGADEGSPDDPPNTVVHEREPRSKRVRDEVQGISGSTRLEAKRQRRRDGRDAGRRRPPILSESEFLARREAVDRVMVVREKVHAAAEKDHEDYTQVAVLEDGVLVEHFVTTANSTSMVGNIYLGRVQNVLPGMEAAFVDIGRGRNGVLYAGEVNWEAAGLDGGSRKIEQALKPGDNVLVQVSKDPVGHKGARLTTQISLAGRYLVYVPGGSSTGISRKLPDVERKRLKSILGKIVPEGAGVIIRTASEGISAEDLEADIKRLEAQWTKIEAATEDSTKGGKGGKAKSVAPKALYEEPDLLVRVVRDLFNEDFKKLVVEGQTAWSLVERYINDVAPDLMDRVERFEKNGPDAPDSFVTHRIDEQLAKALDRKVWLPSGGTLIIEHTEAMTVIDVNTGKFTGSGGNLEETVTRNNLEAAEEIVRQVRLRDLGGMIIVDFIDMVLESNRDLVLRRLTEALARDRTRHQVSEVTSLGLVQMTRKRLGTGLLEAFSTTCTNCAGRGVIVHADPVEVRSSDDAGRDGGGSKRSRRKKGKSEGGAPDAGKSPTHNPAEHPLFRAMHAHIHEHDDEAVDHIDVDEADEVIGVDAADAVDTLDAVEAEAVVATEPDTAEPEAVEPEPAVAESVVEEVLVETVVVEAEPEPAPAPKARHRRVRRAPVSTGSGTTIVIGADNHETPPTQTTTTAGPTSAAAESEAVAVVRRPRRRAASRPSGAPQHEA
ncbi:translation initiation factor IF-2 N-terminal domain-containing protein [Gordonia sp. X0973]|uniref:translation initiation factor IF-2 N-terminal domain-containing protein n=1 Tax=Gordonia sp. X0973 TaxID=2742602 RepID=UPI000F527D8C|nr:translation initiation factor IF-2 N-terminal domain-containing protein [Gordonia sp. X0973]QKT07004.1 translation initiation factor IF-2 N-terminal domain-containing protein [Gordonia sp. X0973]